MERNWTVSEGGKGVFKKWSAVQLHSTTLSHKDIIQYKYYGTEFLQFSQTRKATMPTVALCFRLNRELNNCIGLLIQLQGELDK